MGVPALAPLDQPARRWLLAVAAPSEAKAICQGLGAEMPSPDQYWHGLDLNARLSMVLTGVGKANASGAVARVFNPALHAGVLNLGIAGSLPEGGLRLLDSVLATASVFADEGCELEEGFTDIAALGFAPNAGIAGQPPQMGIPRSDALAPLLAALCTKSGVIATVSTCSGTDERAADVVRRTGAVAEAMEGAAAALAVARITKGGGLFAELRVISNTTGDRNRQAWRMRKALERLGELAALL